jgi:hypothetical protein
MDPQGKIDKVVELLNQSNEILLDMPWQEGNLPTGHLTTVRTGLPTVTWRKMYQGVPAGKSLRAQVTDACGMLTARSEVDKKLADLNGNRDAFRLQEAVGFIEAMNQEMATTLFYGDTDTSPEKFTGLAARYSVLPTNATPAANSVNVIDGGGTAAVNTSVYLISWGPNTNHGIFPKGSKAGLVHQDLGEIDCFDSSGDRYRGYADTFEWDCGLSVRDWRYTVRICNIDTTKLLAQSGAADLIILMIKAIHRLPNIGVVGGPPNQMPMYGRPVFYVNRVVYEMLDIESLNKTNYTLKSGSDVFGRPVTFCRGIPIRCVDALLNTEAAVT